MLEQLAAEDSPHLGPVPVRAGFMPAEPPPLALPGSHLAWDEAAAALPRLWRDLTAQRVLGDELPLLAAGPEALPDAMLWRASTVLGAIAYSLGAGSCRCSKSQRTSEAMYTATLAYLVRQALSDHDGRSMNDEPLQYEQGEREQLVSDVEYVLRRRCDER